MPRLLLVDDNPSIHKIAESLLSGSDVQVVCVDGGTQALALVARGEVFDAALIDIFMSGMDGWALLDALRMHPATASLPVAMMAGVLDTVEPGRLEQARVQGYVKKPVELRDLPDRVRTLIATGGPSSENEPTVAMVSPYATAPALSVRAFGGPPADALPDDLLVLTAEDLLEPAEAMALPSEPVPLIEAGEPVLELETDLEWGAEGLLGEDALPELQLEEEASPAPEAALEPETALEPEALAVVLPEGDLAPMDLDALSLAPLEPLGEVEPDAGFGFGSEPETPPVVPEEVFEPEAPPVVPEEVFEPEVLSGVAEIPPTPSVELLDTPVPDTLEHVPDPPMPSESLEDSVELPDLGPSTELFTPHDILDAPAPEAELPKEWDESEELLSAIQAALPTALVPGPGEAAPEPAPTGELVSPQLELGVGAAMAAGAAAAAAVAPASPAPGSSAEALVEAILADPVALEKLAKALSRQLSQAALREVAWEVMPDLADRLRPH